MGRRLSEELWQYENRYDNDNEATFGSDNDSSVDGYNSDGFPIDSSVTNNICFLHVLVICKGPINTLSLVVTGIRVYRIRRSTIFV